MQTPEFLAALKRNPEATKNMSFMTVHRYIKGDLPQFARWLLENPELAHALAADADAHAASKSACEIEAELQAA